MQRRPGWRDWLDRAVHCAAPPPNGFDPLRASDAELACHHLPARPDPALAPILHAHWEEMLGHPRRILRAAFRPMHDKIAAPRTAFMLRPLIPIVGRGLQSENWAGALIRPNHGRRFTRVIGRWRAPFVAPGTPPVPDLGLPFRASVWVGLDGFYRRSLGLPQIGTEHTVDPSAPGGQRLRVWWQWWLRDTAPDQQAGPQEITNLAVSPGDVVLFDISVAADDLVRFTAKNQASGDLIAPILVPPPPLPHVPAGALVEGTTAEWVVERPHDPEREALFPLPDFTAVGFDRCAAGLGPAPGEPVGATAMREVSLRTARQFRMTERRGPPVEAQPRSTVIAICAPPPHPVRGVRVQYQAP